MIDLKAWVCRHLDELWNLGDLLAADEIYAADYIAHTPTGPRPARGPESAKAQVVLVRTALSELQLLLEDAIAEDNKLAVRWTLRGVDTGGVAGRLPTGQEISVAGVTFLRLAEGKVIEAWESTDLLDRLQVLSV